MFTSASPVPHRRSSDLDKLSNQTRNLMKLTQELLVSRDVGMNIKLETEMFVLIVKEGATDWSVTHSTFILCPKHHLKLRVWEIPGANNQQKFFFFFYICAIHLGCQLYLFFLFAKLAVVQGGIRKRWVHMLLFEKSIIYFSAVAHKHCFFALLRMTMGVYTPMCWAGIISLLLRIGRCNLFGTQSVSQQRVMLI